MASYVFPKVEPADIQRSRRDLSFYKPFTASVGTCIPCLSIDMLPSDWMRINTIATVQSLPMVAPVRGRWKVSFDYFYNPWSNIYGFMDNNTRLPTQRIVNLYRYVFVLGRSAIANTNSLLVNMSKVPCGGVLDFLGCPVGYFGQMPNQENVEEIQVISSSHPAESFLTYIDVIRNYYVNNQLNYVPYITNNVSPYGDPLNLNGPYKKYPLADIDALFSKLRYNSVNGLSSPISVSMFTEIQEYFRSSSGGDYVSSSTMAYEIPRQSGLFMRSYRMDLLRGIMNNSVGEFKAKVNVQSDSSGSYITMDDTYFANKLQQFINRIDITGGRFSDWIQTRWNIDPGIEIDRPIYLGSHSLWLNTIDVVATASGQADVGSRNDSSVVGQQVGYQVGKMTVGKGRDRQRPITIKSKQYGTLMCIFSIVPDVVYSQGFELNMLKTKFADIYDPAFKQLGFQDVLKGELSAMPVISTSLVSGTDDEYEHTVSHGMLDEVVGKRIAWSEYMASLNRSHGEFAYGMSLDYWVNNRRYFYSDNGTRELLSASSGHTPATAEIIDLLTNEFDPTTYIYPHLWNTQFANVDITAMNYMVDVYFQIDANRALGKRLMPHL